MTGAPERGFRLPVLELSDRVPSRTPPFRKNSVGTGRDQVAVSGH